MAVIKGTKKSDTLVGSANDDTITGAAGNDSIDGGGGADSISGGDGADTVHAGEGNDTIVVGRGDLVYGEAGDDTLRFASDEPTGLSATINGDAGLDTLTLDFSASTDAVTTSIFGSGSGTMGGVGFSGIERLVVFGGTASDNLAGGEGEDTLNGGTGNDRLDGRGGANVLIGGAGRDIGLIDLTATTAALVVNFAGVDTTIAGTSFTGIEGLGFKGGQGADQVSVREARASSEIYGGAGDDVLRGENAWGDTLDGGVGKDTLSFGRGDVARGGDDDDQLSIVTDEVTGGFTSVSGDAGADTLTVNFSAAVDAITSSNNSGFGNVGGISYSNIEKVIFFGGSASDTLVGGMGADTLNGGLGNDRLEGQGGANKLVGGAGRDVGLIDVSTDATPLTVVFKAAKITIAGTQLQEIEGLGVKAGGGADNINVAQAQAKSELFGNGGSDTLVGSAAWSDTLDGGVGDDHITFGHGDNVHGGFGEDDLRINQAPVAGASTLLDGDEDVDTLTINFSAFGGAVTSSNSNAGSGTIGGISYSDIELLSITTGGGNDSLAGGQGSDTLNGGAGNDSLTGASDVDYLTGGLGADVLSGGLSGDQFRFLSTADSTVNTAGRDTITDWSSQDRIDLNLIDANTTADLDQAFTFIGTAAFGNVAGQLRYETVDNVTIVTGDVNGDGQADFAIAITGTFTLQESYFVL